MGSRSKKMVCEMCFIDITVGSGAVSAVGVILIEQRYPYVCTHAINA